MSERMTVSYQKKPCYDIIFERDFQALSEELKALDLHRRSCVSLQIPMWVRFMQVRLKKQFLLCVRIRTSLLFQQEKRIRTWIR